MKEHLTNHWRSPGFLPSRSTVAMWVTLLAALTLHTGCHKKNIVGLSVDVYLHPEAGTPDDLLLQTAIQKQIDVNDVTKNSLIHVRVVDRIAFLTGTVRTQAEKQKANDIAQAINLSVNQDLIRTQAVHDNIAVEQ